MRPFLLLAAALGVVSCGASVWNRPVDGLKADLAAGKTSFVLSLTAQDLADADLRPLGSGAAWTLGALFSENDRQTEAELLWKRSLSEEGPPWRDQAGQDLFDLYAGRRDWPKAEALALRLKGPGPGSPAVQRLLFEAYYFQKKDDLAWPLLKAWGPGLFNRDQEKENRLFAGVLLARAGRADEACAVLRDLVFDQPASVLQFRLESFFQEDESRYDLLGPGGREAVAFQSLVYRGVSKDVQDWLRGRTLPSGFWNHRALVEGLESVFRSESRAETGLRLLDRAQADTQGEALFAVTYARGRLYRVLGWWPQARRSFQEALGRAAAADDRQKSAWNWLNAWVETDPEAALGPFVQVLSATDDPAYFEAVVESWFTELIQRRNWGLLAAAGRDLSHRLSSSEKATLWFLLARLASHGLVDVATEGLRLSATGLLEQTIAADPFSYEALVARAVLGRGLDFPPPSAEPEFLASDALKQRHLLWSGLASFGLARRLVAEVLAWEGPVDPAFIERTAAALQASGLYRPSLQLLYRLLRDPGRTLTQARALLLYPRAYEDLAAPAAQAQGLDLSLLLGLMREESSFDPQARSPVGAQGLTQLMPATAAETARSLRLTAYDLSVPADNIALGACYLAQMIRSQGRIYLALMAYNAGGGRIKAWKDTLGRLPEEIFVEAAPILETRGYVKKILSSAVLIGVLHYGKSPADMVRLIYPGFAP